jgi:hypothetical protein
MLKSCALPQFTPRSPLVSLFGFVRFWFVFPPPTSPLLSFQVPAPPSKLALPSGWVWDIHIHVVCNQARIFSPYFFLDLCRTSAAGKEPLTTSHIVGLFLGVKICFYLGNPFCYGSPFHKGSKIWGVFELEPDPHLFPFNIDLASTWERL